MIKISIFISLPPSRGKVRMGEGEYVGANHPELVEGTGYH
jgi:hypothetical protein